MSSVPPQYMVRLYIHPDKGPISGMDLDMLSLETDVMGLDAYTNRDEARVRLIANRIKAAFPDVDVSGNLDALSLLMRRLGHVSSFSGVVLRLPGSISGPAQPVSSTATELARLTDELLYLKDEMQKLQQQKNTLEAKIPVLEKEAQQAVNSLKDQQGRLRATIIEKDEVLDQLDALTKKSNMYEAEASRLQKENAALLVQEEQIKGENQRLLRFRDEVAKLRQANMNSDVENQQLRDTVEKYKQEVVRLNQKYKGQEQEAEKWKHEYDALAASMKNAADILQQSPPVKNQTKDAAQPSPQMAADRVKREWLDG